MLELSDNGVIAGEEAMYTSVFRPEETIYIKAHLHMGYLRSGNKGRRIETRAQDIREEQVATPVKQEDVVFIAGKFAPQSSSSSLKPFSYSL